MRSFDELNIKLGERDVLTFSLIQYPNLNLMYRADLGFILIF